jgi:hypothetical protein
VREFWFGVGWLAPTAVALVVGGGLAYGAIAAGVFGTHSGWDGLGVMLMAAAVVIVLVALGSVAAFRYQGFYNRLQQDAGVPETWRPFGLSGFEVVLALLGAVGILLAV